MVCFARIVSFQGGMEMTGGDRRIGGEPAGVKTVVLDTTGRCLDP